MSIYDNNYDELEYMEKIVEVIETKVESRLTEKVADIEKLHEKQERYGKVEDLFDGWDKCECIYYIDSYNKRVKCPICEDSGYITKKADGMDNRIDCPLCKKYASLAEYKAFYAGSNYKPILWISIINCEVIPYFTIRNHGEYITPTSWFRSKEEAQDFANKQNEINKTQAENNIINVIKREGWDKLIKTEGEKK